MGEHTHSGTIDASPDVVFAYLRDVGNLPRYFPGMVAARAHGTDDRHHAERVEVEAEIGEGARRDGEGWFRADEAARRIEWGASDDNGYRGWLEVTEEADGSSLELFLNTPHVDEGALDLDETVNSIRADLADDVE